MRLRTSKVIPSPALKVALASLGAQHDTSLKIRLFNININLAGPITADAEAHAGADFNAKASEIILSDPRERRAFAKSLARAYRGSQASAAELQATRDDIERQLLDGLAQAKAESAGADSAPESARSEASSPSSGEAPRQQPRQPQSPPPGGHPATTGQRPPPAAAPASPPPPKDSFSLRMPLVSASPPAATRWLWPGKIPLGDLTLLGGHPGIGKSMVTLDLAARVSVGGKWPDGSGEAPLGDVILVSFEDKTATTIRPRLDRAGANVDRVHRLEGTATQNKHGLRHDPFSLREPAVLAWALYRQRQAKLVIIDPIAAAMPDGTLCNETAVRDRLGQLATIAASCGVAIILVTHLSKSGGGGGSRAIARPLGSVAFVGVCRAAWVCTRDPADAAHRLMLPLKNNFGDDSRGIGYRINDSGVMWDETQCNVTADEAMSGEGRHAYGPPPQALDQAQQWLAELLAGGALPTSKVETEAKAAGLSWMTIRRAADQLGVSRKKDQQTRIWFWKLDGASV